MPANLPWLEMGESFPPVESAWGPMSEAPGLLAAGRQLDLDILQEAYDRGIFPWFGTGQPVLWWSPDPRMLLNVAEFRLHDSMRKSLKKFLRYQRSEIRFDTAFQQVIQYCAQTPRSGQNGTWIQKNIVESYTDLHRIGHAHSVETWLDGELVGGLYCVNRGQFVFGESMFARRTNASKIALAALVAFCRAHQMQWIDCQQNSRHLSSLGAKEVSRADFLVYLGEALSKPSPTWKFEPAYWKTLIDSENGQS